MQHIADTTEKPLHILHLMYIMNVGGAETMLTDIINGQVARGHAVTLVVVNKSVNPDLIARLHPSVSVIRMNREPGSRPLVMMLRLNMLLARLRPDIVHAHHHKFGRLVQWSRRRLLLTVHDVGTPMVYCGTTRMAAITDAVEADIKARVPSANVTTVYNGIRTADIPRRKATPDTPHPLRVIQVARLSIEKKGQDVLIRALGILARRGLTDLEATFVGVGDDLAPLQEIARAEGVADRVHFTGLLDRDHIYSHLHEYDVMCHPSRYEGFGLTIAEGMAAGLPLAVTEGDGPWEVADHGRLCKSFAAGDPEGCASALEALTNDWKGAEERAAEASGYVRRFDISNTVDGYIALYRNMLSR